MYIRQKRYVVEGLKCQGRTEKGYIDELVDIKSALPTKPSRIETPFGYYTPDFEFETEYIEIKSPKTFNVMLGLTSWIKDKPLSDKQYKKILWVNMNVKPVHIIIYTKSIKGVCGIDFDEVPLKITIKLENQ